MDKYQNSGRSIRPTHDILVLMASGSRDGSEEPVHLHSLANAFASHIHKRSTVKPTGVKWPLKNRQNNDLNDKW